MHQKSKDIQLQYKGFASTPSLWTTHKVRSLEQFEIEGQPLSFNRKIDTKLRLGKYVEQFVAYQLRQDKRVQVIDQNIQIQEDKRTLGEIDFVIRRNGSSIHIETVYKFYLYYPSSVSELHCWIGPNRKDSLIEKLDKLRDKQLPIVHTTPCKDYLQSQNISSDEILQQVYFKAQLFVPYASDVAFEQLNKECVSGFYLRQKELASFKNCKFYIPSKKDWLVIPHTQVNWISYEDFLTLSETYLGRKFSPLCWLKSKNGELHKFFLVWW